MKACARVRAFWLIAALVCGSIAPSIALAEGVPTDLQAALLLRTLSYDHQIKERANASVAVAVVFKPGNSESEGAAKQMTAAIEDAAKRATVAGLPAKAVAVAFGPKFDSDLKASGALAIYVCPGFEGSIDTISRASRTASIVSFTGTESFVDSGVSIAFVFRSGKAGIVIALKSAQAEGADLDGALLRIAEVRK